MFPKPTQKRMKGTRDVSHKQLFCYLCFLFFLFHLTPISFVHSWKPFIFFSSRFSWCCSCRDKPLRSGTVVRGGGLWWSGGHRSYTKYKPPP
ncbi:hypothetical protein H4Q32_008479 [Labeo rohita]|uniref:Uncharacterized protein n=1 Tax=Labeo rohita TaxID=84645 RepID=A0ABQ8MDL6_LABRO|nr:hypothetical protein H4Q32_008479 [Labeo rohita]